jgi:hypothetical protein
MSTDDALDFLRRFTPVEPDETVDRMILGFARARLLERQRRRRRARLVLVVAASCAMSVGALFLGVEYLSRHTDELALRSGGARSPGVGDSRFGELATAPASAAGETAAGEAAAGEATATAPSDIASDASSEARALERAAFERRNSGARRTIDPRGDRNPEKPRAKLHDAVAELRADLVEILADAAVLLPASENERLEIDALARRYLDELEAVEARISSSRDPVAVPTESRSENDELLERAEPRTRLTD